MEERVAQCGLAKDSLQLVDRAFSHSKLGYCSDHQTSKRFEWDRKLKNPSLPTVFTDRCLDLTTSEFTRPFAWLIEPRAIQPDVYSYIEVKNTRFLRVFTHDKELLSRGENYEFVPFGCCWIPIQDQQIYNKTKDLSLIASEKNQTEGHKLRHEVVERFREFFDLFGRGYNPISLKLSALKDYRFQIVIENCRRDYWFTEKLIDCFVTATIPVYWGCPEIGKFFDQGGIISIEDIDDLSDVLPKLTQNLYTDKLGAILKNFRIAQSFLLPDDYIYEGVLRYFKNSRDDDLV